MTGGVVLATRELPEPFDTLRPDFEVRVLGYNPTELELAAEVPGVDALICLVDDPVTAAVIAAADRLKIIASYAVGVNQIDRAAAAARGILVTHTPNVADRRHGGSDDGARARPGAADGRGRPHGAHGQVRGMGAGPAARPGPQGQGLRHRRARAASARPSRAGRRPSA